MLKDLKKYDKDKGQALIEFSFSMVVVLLMFFAVVAIFSWVGRDLVDRRKAHEEKLLIPTEEDYFTKTTGPIQQITPQIYKVHKINAVFGD